MPATNVCYPFVAREGSLVGGGGRQRCRVEQAAALWQERARNLGAQVEQFLALPAHVEEPRRRWWPWRRRGA